MGKKRVLLFVVACLLLLTTVAICGCGTTANTSNDPEIRSEAKLLLSELNATSLGTEGILAKWANTPVGALCIKKLAPFKGGSGYQVDMLVLKDLAGE